MYNYIQQYDNYNYWEIDIKELPSRGRFYSDNAKIKVRSMSVMEVKFLATLLDSNATNVCNEILEKCTILFNLNYEDLILADRQYLIFWIRLNSFTNTNGYTISIQQCPVCKHKIDYNFKLTDLEFRYLDHPFNNIVHLPDLDIDLPISLPKYNDAKILLNDDIDEIAIYIDSDNTFKEKYRFTSGLSALDFIALKKHIEENSCGIKHEYKIECKDCNSMLPVEIKIDDRNLFSNVNLMQILETITRICKYSNLQITNDWSWVEVEIEQEVINKMIQEENEMNKRELAKANSKANTSIPHAPSIPSYR